jgi:hypothetical protein
MTESTLLAEAPAAPVETESNNRRALLFGAVAGALALLVAVYFLFFTGGSEDVALSSGPSRVPAVTKVVPKKVAPKKAAAAVPATFAGVHAKDPFKPLINPPAPVATAAPISGTGTGFSNPPQVLTLTSVGSTGVTVSVNGTAYSPKTGALFATFFKLVKLQGASCATFLYGDESFDLCKGSSITKQ